MYPNKIPSPIIPKSALASLVETLSAEHIARLYLESFGYSVAEDFAGLDEIAIYECEATGYRFFYPYTLQGKEALYRAIENFEWTYQESKWEHEKALQHVPDNAAVLDVGCGRGAFLAKALARTKNVTGIELNRSAASFARERGISVVETLIGDHAKDRPSAYDVVTAFQVLEHIADPMPFLGDCIACLRNGGLLIIGVPNNDGFQRFAPDNILNQPPHHVGLWSPRSLAALADLLPIKVISIEEEPLREIDWYQQVMERRYLPKRWQRSLYYRLGGHKVFRRFIEENADSISGHTVMAIYQREPA